MLILGLDFETNSSDPKTCDVLEVGAALWHVERKIPLSFLSTYVSGMTVKPEAQVFNGIQQEDLDLYGQPLDAARLQLLDMVERCDAIVAHNGTRFDRPIFERLINLKKPWVDTMTDVAYPKHITTRSLTGLAAEHDILNPFRHRAVFDVLTMLRLLSHYDFPTVLTYSQIPLVEVRAHTSFQEKHRAKARGYYWDADRMFWVKSFKETEVERERAEADFEITVLK